MTGTILAATFSWGCQRANQLGITEILKRYAKSQGKSHSEKEIREALKKLFSYFYYRVIAKSNNIKDPFDLKVVKAHWIGNELLEKVKPHLVKRVFQEMENYFGDKVILAFVAEPLIKTGSAHHNTYCHHDLECSVLTDGEYFYHLGEKRLKALPQDIENLKKYGRK